MSANADQFPDDLLDETLKEETRFGNTINVGLRKFNQISKEKNMIDGRDAFLLFQSFGFPIEITKELASEKGIPVDEKGFDEEFTKHQSVSRLAAEKEVKVKSGQS